MKMKSERDYASENDADTLMRAAEINQDHERCAAAMKHIKMKKKAINSIAELKKVAKEKMEEEDETE